MNARAFFSILVLLMAGGVSVASAQTAGGIQINGDSYMEAPTLPLGRAKTFAKPLTAIPANEARDRFLLRGGEPLHTDLVSWASSSGWELYWYPRVSWRTLRDTVINRQDVTEAVAEVVEILRDEGKPISLRVSEGNKIMEVLSQEVRND